MAPHYGIYGQLVRLEASGFCEVVELDGDRINIIVDFDLARGGPVTLWASSFEKALSEQASRSGSAALIPAVARAKAIDGEIEQQAHEALRRPR